jgi:hypothetical protein
MTRNVTSAIASSVGTSHRMRETAYWNNRFLRSPDGNEGVLLFGEARAESRGTLGKTA